MKTTIIGLLLATTLLLAACSLNNDIDEKSVTSFDECVQAGYPVMESYPRQCNDGKQTFTEVIDEELIIGGERDDNGCLGPAGYAYDDSIGACIRNWELDEGQREAASIVIQSLGSKGWTVVEVAPADTCDDCYTVTLDRYGARNMVSLAEGRVISATGGVWACTMEYMPVCGKLPVQCVTAPCDPILQTFGNRCSAEGAGAFDIVEGECPEEASGTVPSGPVMSACAAFGGTWLPEFHECEGISEQECLELGGSYDACASACRNDPDAEMCTLQCVIVCSLK